jgi:hypothetical protein
MTRNARVVAAASGLLGFPPVSVAATLSPALVARPLPLLPLILAMRVCRFTVIAAIAAGAASRRPW